MTLDLPASYLAMPRWWRASAADRAWLAALPQAFDAWCTRWSLRPDGPPAHGSHAVVVPVLTDDGPAVLRLTPPSEDLRPQLDALALWRGRGVVGVLRSDAAAGAMLLERLGRRTLRDAPLSEAVAELGRTARRLAIPVPSSFAGSVTRSADVVAARTPEFRPTWEQLGRPLPERLLDAATDAAAHLVDGSRPLLAVDADLHPGQLLAAPDGTWHVVDPVLQAGDAERSAVETLWHRVDEMPDDDIPRWFDMLVEAGDLDRDLALAWARWRVVDYALWGLAHGLTEDPVRCRRVAEALLG